jgi:uncharacterized membrane protein YfcA
MPAVGLTGRRPDARRSGNVDIRLALSLLLGSLIGVVIGIRLAEQGSRARRARLRAAPSR